MVMVSKEGSLEDNRTVVSTRAWTWGHVNLEHRKRLLGILPKMFSCCSSAKGLRGALLSITCRAVPIHMQHQQWLASLSFSCMDALRSTRVCR